MGKLRMRVRFDFIGRDRGSRLFFGSKNSEQAAEEIRQHKASLIRNIPIQGINIEEIDMNQEIYAVYDDLNGKAVTFAPLIISFAADTIEDALKFTMKEEFRTIEILEPEEVELKKIEIERILLKVNEELINYKNYVQRKIDNWK